METQSFGFSNFAPSVPPTPMLDQILSLLALGVIGSASYGIGSLILRGLRVGQDDPLSETVWSLAIGLVVAGTFLAGLGMVGGLYVPLIGTLSIAACFWGVGQAMHGWAKRYEERISCPQAPAEPFDTPAADWARPSPWVLRTAWGLAGLAALGSLIAALAPPTAGDALCYHLELPKTFLADHALGYLPDDDTCTFPLLAEMWYLWALALDGPVAAQLIHWGVGILLGLATVVLAAPILGRPWAWVAGAVVILVPAVTNQMTAPLNDLPLALMTTLALGAWWRGAINQESRRWFVLAGLALGGAAATKYLAMVFIAAMAGASLWLFARYRLRRRILVEGLAIMIVVAASVGGLWYLRAAWYRGNPVYPLFTEFFARDVRGKDSPPITLPENKAPLGRRPLGLATAVWHTTMHPERFGGRGHQAGVVFLAALPGLLVVRRLRGMGTLLAVAGLYWVVWWLLRQNVRFLLPILPPLSVAVVWVWVEMRRFPLLPRRVAAGLFALALAGSAAAALDRGDGKWAVALGLQSRDQFLRSHEPTWPAACVANRVLVPADRLLSQDYRAYYFQCHVVRENAYRRRTNYPANVAQPADLSRVLRQAGFTHLLLVENLGSRGIQYDNTLSRLVDAQWATATKHSLVKLAEYQFPDSDGATRRYRLVMLRD